MKRKTPNEIDKERKKEFYIYCVVIFAVAVYVIVFNELGVIWNDI